MLAAVPCLIYKKLLCCGFVSLTTCPQRDYTGKMGFNEFKELFTVLNGWKQNFVMVDRDGSGTVEPHELSQCFSNMGECSHVSQMWKSVSVDCAQTVPSAQGKMYLKV